MPVEYDMHYFSNFRESITFPTRRMSRHRIFCISFFNLLAIFVNRRLKEIIKENLSIEFIFNFFWVE